MGLELREMEHAFQQVVVLACPEDVRVVAGPGFEGVQDVRTHGVRCGDFHHVALIVVVDDRLGEDDDAAVALTAGIEVREGGGGCITAAALDLHVDSRAAVHVGWWG